MIRNIDEDTKRMKRTTRDLLDLTRVETGNIQLNVQKADPLSLVEYAYNTMLVQAKQKDIQMEYSSDEKLPLIKTDLQKSVWVLLNLISNAIRYTAPGGLVRIKAEDLPEAIKFSVIDNGIGIPSEYLDKVFQKYFRVHEGQNDGDGSGLGLAIAKEFIKAQGGEIGVESKLGAGSTFYFTLPKDLENMKVCDKYKGS